MFITSPCVVRPILLVKNGFVNFLAKGNFRKSCSYDVGQVDYWGRFHQHFTHSFHQWRYQKRKKTLMTWLSFFTFGIWVRKSSAQTCWWNQPFSVLSQIFEAWKFTFTFRSQFILNLSHALNRTSSLLSSLTLD